MLRLAGGQVESLLDELLSVEVRELPADLAALDRLLADRRLLAPITQAWAQTAQRHGRPTIPMTSFVRLMVIKQRTGWGYCLCGSTPSMTKNMDVSLQLTGRGAVADSPTFGRHAHASVQSGHDRAPADGMPTVSQPMAAGCLRAIPSTPWARYLTEQHAEHSQQVGCLPWLDQPSARSRQGRADRARCRPVKRQCPAPRHSPATAPHPLALDGCRQVSELLADQALEAAKSRSTQRVF
jgi:hypothetical protein